MKRTFLGALAAAAATAALAMPSSAAATTDAPVCGDMRPVDCVVYYLFYYDPCLLCDGDDAARTE